MPRRRKDNERGNGRGGSGFRGASLKTTNNTHVDAWQGKGISPESHFSLIEEARNTERHHSWNSDLKLRHSRIVFVSAGATKADDLIQTRQERVEERSEAFQESVEETRDGLAAAIGKHLASANIAIVPEIPLSNMSLSDSNVVGLDFEVCDPTKAEHMREGRSEKETASSSIFFTDFNGSEIPYTGLATPAVRHTPSSDASDSSEEVILFAGRRASKTRTQEKLDCSRKSSVHPFSESTKLIPRVTATVIEDSVGINLDGATSVPEALSQGLTINTHTADSTPFRKDKSETFGRRLRRRRKGERPSKRAEYDAEIVADYIANLSDNEELNTSVGNSAYNRRDLGGSDDQWQDDEKTFAVEQQVDHGILSVGEWDSAYLRDFDDLSTSSEALDTIEQILLKRERISGLQYLVLGKGCTVDDARWLPISMLKSLGADEQVRLFEEEQAECEQLCESSEDSRGNVSRDEQLAMNLHGDLDDLGNERDLKESGREIMTDEQIARVLAKQEELGLGSNDLLLLDGEGFANNGMEDVPLDGSWGPSLQPRQRPKQKKGHRDGFPSATFIADVLEQDHYNGFDVMDQDRASLHRRAKGRRGKPALELSDSEVEQAITVAWENDRTKKKIRKQEREEFRVRGLLGKGDKVDMKAKYSEGMSMDEVKYEIREFLSSTLETLPLPPLAQKERKIVHEIANVFNLKSKSIGTGKSRFPVMYKTPRTIEYNERSLNNIEAMLSSKRFLPRSDKAKKRRTPTGKARGGFASAGVSYRDGEIVGATAPELGQENRGRAMLEKMGWSTGTVLGALNNTRGIVQPVTQIVKTGKAGLG